MIFEAVVQNAQYGRVVALEKLTLRVGAGQVVGILGANGAGKTTSLRAIVGNVICETRKLFLDEEDLSGLPTWQLARRGIVFCPDGAPCFGTLTILENLASVYTVCKTEVQTKGKTYDELLGDVFSLFPVLRDRQHQLAGTLSGGERRMLALGRVLMLAPTVLLLDEPSAGLAPKIVGELYRAIARIKRAANAAIVLAEQNAKVCFKISNHGVVLEQGRVAVEGSSSQLSENDEVRKVYLGV